MQAIITKYIPATDRRGSRIKATSGAGESITIPYPHPLSGEAAYRAAAETLCAKLHWGGTLIAGNLADGWVYVFAPKSFHAVNPR